MTFHKLATEQNVPDGRTAECSSPETVIDPMDSALTILQGISTITDATMEGTGSAQMPPTAEAGSIGTTTAILWHTCRLRWQHKLLSMALSLEVLLHHFRATEMAMVIRRKLLVNRATAREEAIMATQEGSHEEARTATETPMDTMVVAEDMVEDDGISDGL